MNTLTELKEQLLKENLFDDKFPIRSCTNEEIEVAMVNQKVKRLPQIYIDFARIMGNGAGYLFKGSQVMCYTAIDIKSKLAEVFADDFKECQFQLPSDAFIYQAHPDFFAYFLTDNSLDDPAVYRFNIHFSQNPQTIQTFWAHIMQQYDELISIKAQEEHFYEKNKEMLKQAWIKAELERQKRVKKRHKKNGT